MATLIFMIVCGTLGVAFSKSPLLDAEYLLGRDWRLGTGWGGWTQVFPPFQDGHSGCVLWTGGLPAGAGAKFLLCY